VQLNPRRRRVIRRHILILHGFILGFALLGGATLCSARDLALIVNKSNSVRTLTSADLGKLASGSLPAWPAGGKVTFILRDPSTPAMKVAAEKLFGTTADKIKALIAANPAFFVIVNTDDDVIRMVESLPGAVGLIDIYSITSSVHVVKVNGKLPLEPGYALHGN
jgi:ABC-type phosphate transport system substrate-binding protein